MFWDRQREAWGCRRSVLIPFDPFCRGLLCFVCVPSLLPNSGLSLLGPTLARSAPKNTRNFKVQKSVCNPESYFLLHHYSYHKHKTHTCFVRHTHTRTTHTPHSSHSPSATPPFVVRYGLISQLGWHRNSSVLVCWQRFDRARATSPPHRATCRR